MSYKQSLGLFFVIVLIGIIVINNVSSQEITPSNYSSYSNQMITDNFNIYFKNNTNLDSAVRFEKEGYFFTYDLSGGAMQWAEQPGFPARTNTLGSGAPSNSQNCLVNISQNEFSYPSAYYNTTVKYEILNNKLKETFILGGLPSLKDYTYLEYTGNIKFNKTLQICDEIT